MDYLIKDFGKILKKNALMMRRLLLQEDTDCMRVYDRNLEELPLSVDLYGKYARITDYSEEGLTSELEETVIDVVRRMCYIQQEYVCFHRREKRHNKEQHELQSSNSLVIEVKEFSHRFKVDLIKRIDTGLFLDHYKTRKLVESISKDLSVLNLFAYTGSFSVYAASGGAKLVESIDLSKTYTDWAQYNLTINGFEGDKYPCINTDALEYIIEAARNKKQYDLIILDPPSFSNSRKMNQDFDIQRDYVRYLRLINNLLSKDGKVIFSTNLSSFHMDPGRLKGYKVENITKDILADGFSKKKGTSRTWLLAKESKVKLTKEDYEGKKYFAKSKSSEQKKRINKMDKDPQNDLEQIISNLENEFDGNDDNVNDDLTLRWDATYENNTKKSNYDRKFKEKRSYSRNDGDRKYSRDDRDRKYSRDDRDRRYSREDTERKFNREDGDRKYSRDNRDRKYSREDGDRKYSRDDRDRKYSREDGDRKYSRDNRDRKYSREDGDRKYSRDNRDRKYSREDGDRKYSRDDRDRKYSREDGDRRFSRDDREKRYSREDGDRKFSRDNRDRKFSREDGDRRFSRDDREKRYSREAGDRKFSRDNRDRKYSREDGDRKFSRDDRDRSYSRDNRDSNSDSGFTREKRVKRSKPVPYGFEKNNKNE
ncbi:MAG: class I SAM-dependent methyltransferase [Pleomorphochaeta sp.]